LITAGLARAGVIRARTLLRQWRYAVLGCSILGAMITPPEFGLHLAALFLLLSIYFLGVLTAALAGR
jgi:Sec-independent protein secretion pathway component TatC